MRCRFLLVLAAVGGLGGCGGSIDGGGDDGSSSPDASGSTSEPAGLEGTVAAHNAIRSAHGVGPLTWDPALQVIAQNWANQCVDTDGDGLIDHNAGRSTNYPTYVGENVYASTGQAGGTDAVADWASEEADYDYASNGCSRVCGHYTQIVWADTQKVGCGISTCPGLRYSSTIVCDYGPGGNISGQKPY